MKNKLFYPAARIASALLLCGCNGGTDTSDISVTAENTSAETETLAVSVTSVTSETPTERENIRENISDEQSVLEKLIADTAGNTEGYTVQSPLFGDFDGDGVNELIALYSNRSEFADDCWYGEIWFSSGDTACRLTEKSDWTIPQIITSRGDTFIKTEKLFATGALSYYFSLKNSVAEDFEIPYTSDLTPLGEYGDFVALRDEYDISSDQFPDEDTPIWTGHTHKPYWFYYLDGEMREYCGKEITEAEFLAYDGAQTVLDEISSGEYALKNILKRGNGRINVNCVKIYETEDFRSEAYCYKTFYYRCGRLIPYDEGKGFYSTDPLSAEQTDFERFSEMIYDTAEGDENSSILERYFGDFSGDGKNELYVRYGTDGDSSLWLADENGARQVSSEEFEAAAQTDKNNG